MKTVINIFKAVKEVSIRIVLGFFLSTAFVGVLYFVAQILILFEIV